jgi:hypothetical protein
LRLGYGLRRFWTWVRPVTASRAAGGLRTEASSLSSSSYAPCVIQKLVSIESCKYVIGYSIHLFLGEVRRCSDSDTCHNHVRVWRPQALYPNSIFQEQNETWWYSCAQDITGQNDLQVKKNTLLPNRTLGCLHLRSFENF